MRMKSRRRRGRRKISFSLRGLFAIDTHVISCTYFSLGVYAKRGKDRTVSSITRKKWWEFFSFRLDVRFFFSLIRGAFVFRDIEWARGVEIRVETEKKKLQTRKLRAKASLPEKEKWHGNDTEEKKLQVREGSEKKKKVGWNFKKHAKIKKTPGYTKKISDLGEMINCGWFLREQQFSSSYQLFRVERHYRLNYSSNVTPISSEPSALFCVTVY